MPPTARQLAAGPCTAALNALRMSREGPVAVLTIDRPDKRNAMTAAMWTALPAVLAEVADDPG